MFTGERRERIMCVAGCDDESLAALGRARVLSQPGCQVQAIFVVPSEMPGSRSLDASWFQAWALRKAALSLALSDILVCRANALSSTLDEATDTSTKLIVCPAPEDPSSAIGDLSVRMLWAQAARANKPLLLARRTVSPRMILAVSDGTPGTLSALRLAFDLGERSDAAVCSYNPARIPIERAEQAFAQLVHTALPSVNLSSPRGPASLPSVRFANGGPVDHIAHAAVSLRADVLVVPIPRSDPGRVDQLVRSVACSVLAIPCR